MSLDLLINWQPFETTFQGEIVTMEIRPFKRKAMMAILPYLTKHTGIVKDDISDKKIGELADAGFELQGMAADVLPEVVRKITGITINGTPATFDDLAEEPMLLPLTLAIITKVATISQLNQADVKNSDGLSGFMDEQAETDR